MERVAHDTRIVDDLEARMWLGFTTDALGELDRIVNSPSRHDDLRSAAARAVARWRISEGEAESALPLLELARELTGTTAELAALEADCLCLLGRPTDALRVLAPLASVSELDASFGLRVAHCRSLLAGPRAHGSGDVTFALNQALSRHGYALIRRADIARPTGIDNLASAGPRNEPPVGTALVTVIVPAYNAEHTIAAALESLLSQTWENLQIIVVDDCSTDATNDLVREFCRRDDRVELVTQPVSHGTYGCRNLGLTHARGDYVATHDAGDWSHPQKIEIQVRLMESRRSLVASGSSCVRMKADLTPAPFACQPDERLVGKTASSLMFKRSVFEEIGNWDQVAASGDAEFRQRAQAFYGVDAIGWVDPEVPLTIARSDGTSLTTDEMIGWKTGFHALGPRAQYREMYQWWHSSGDFAAVLPYHSPTQKRPFPCPDALLPRVPTHASTTYDLVLVGDLSTSDDFVRSVALTTERLGGERRIAFLHLPPTPSGIHPTPVIRDLVFRGLAELVSRDDAVAAPSVIIGWSALETGLLDVMPSVATDDVMLLLPTPGQSTSTENIRAQIERWLSTRLRTGAFPDLSERILL